MSNIDELCKEINKCFRQICTLKKQNRINEQQQLVMKLKQNHGSYRSLSAKSGIPLKTVHQWCCIPKDRKHKGTAKAEIHRQKFTNFLMQDTITYNTACKRYAAKRFMVDMWDSIYQKYVNQPEYHTNGVISKSTMCTYKPKNILLGGSTPVNQCLCNYSENCNLLIKSLVAAGVKGIPPNKYLAVDSILCDLRQGQFGTTYTFA